MDTKQFDNLTKTLSGLLSRRGLIRTVTTVTGGAALGMVGGGLVGGEDSTAAAEVDAAKKNKTCGRTKKCPVPANPCQEAFCKRSKKKQKNGQFKKKCARRAKPDGTVCGTNQTCSNGQCGTSVPGGCTGGQTDCSGVCTDLKTDESNCGACARTCSNGQVCSNGFTCQGQQCLPVTEIEADVELAANGGLTLNAAPPETFGAFAFGVPNGTTFAEVDGMRSNFDFASGSTCGAGTPRFGIVFKEAGLGVLSAQFPTDLCDSSGDDGNTGNLIGNNTPGVWFNLGGTNPITVNTYADALAQRGNKEIDYIFLVADSSNGEQTVTVKPCVTVTD